MTYTFTCEALFDVCLPGHYCAAVCPSGTGVVVEEPEECPDPITQITVTSHTNTQIVQNSSVTLSGTVDGNVSSIEVTVGGTTYTDTTIVNGVWSVDIVLPTQGNNPISIVAHHANGDIDCELIKKFALVYKPVSIIYDPRIEVNCDENSARNNQFICGEEITCVAHFNNTPGTVNVQSFTGASFPVRGGTVTEIISSTGNITCQVFDPQGVPQALCDGSVSANNHATVVFKVKLDQCTCGDDNNFDLL